MVALLTGNSHPCNDSFADRIMNSTGDISRSNPNNADISKHSCHNCMHVCWDHGNVGNLILMKKLGLI